MADKRTTNSINFSSLIFLIFLTLKLGGWGAVATWSWWWVTSPLWLPLVALIITAVVVVVIKAITELFN
jgi:hypothetical protein